MTTRLEEIESRRIFGIISHPDAGKTTLTEKLLLHGGAIREAGTVKARRNSKFATSDWMEIEKQRGISVTSSVMQFEYAGKVISIMDTPGHNDFGEDTYRILTSVDSAVMVIDGAKGIEAQTKKLFKVCSMRGIPIFTFINKIDRETKDPFDLVQELEDVLGLPSVPVTWPIGNGLNFEGIYDILKNEVHLYKAGKTITLGEDGVFGPELESEIAGYNLSALRDEIELIQGAGNDFNMDLIAKGKLSPVFFGSALADALDKDCSYDVVQSVHEQLRGRIQEHKESKEPEPLTITKGTVKGVLASCGVSQDHVEAFDGQYDEAFGADTDLSPRNLVDPKLLEVKTPDVTIRVSPERSDLVETRVIDGKRYILIRADDGVEVNGVNVHIS